MQTIKIPVVSPAPSPDYGNKAEREMWNCEFVQKATRKDAEGHPLEGTFGLDCGVCVDLRTATDKEVRASYIATQAERGKSTRSNHPKSQLWPAHKLLAPNALFAFKKGTEVIAWAMITSPYTYDASEPHMKHRWGYRIMRWATAEERIKLGGCLNSFVPDAVTAPEDVIALRRALFTDALRVAQRAREEAEAAAARAREVEAAAALALANL